MLEPLTLSVRDAAGLLGVSHWTIRRWIRFGTLPAVKLGRRTVVEVSALKDLVEKSRSVSNSIEPGA
jgi:excisionase family DNA binding protein